MATQHYKDTDGTVYGYKKNDTCVPITLEEIEAERQAAKTPEDLQAEAIAHYKGLYLEVVNAKLKALDYDSLATVKLWEGDATFGAEATRILTWYKAIIAKNYQLLNAGVPLTDEEYLAQINGITF